MRSALRMSFEKMVGNGKGKKKQVFNGNAVAISSTLALTALHGYVKVGHAVTLHTSSGVKLKGTVVLDVYEAEAVDISVIALTEGEFPCYTPVAIQPVTLLETIFLKTGPILAQVHRIRSHYPDLLLTRRRRRFGDTFFGRPQHLLLPSSSINEINLLEEGRI